MRNCTDTTNTEWERHGRKHPAGDPATTTEQGTGPPTPSRGDTEGKLLRVVMSEWWDFWMGKYKCIINTDLIHNTKIYICLLQRIVIFQTHINITQFPELLGRLYLKDITPNTNTDFGARMLITDFFIMVKNWKCLNVQE